MRINNRALMILIAGFAVATVGSAQPPQGPKPGPEVQKLGYFVGKWRGEGEMKPGPFGPGGKFTEMEDAEWMPGGFFVTIHADEKFPMGDGKTLMVLGYDPEQKVYTFNAFNSMGLAEAAKGTLDGDTWTWLSELNMGGKIMKSRFIMKQLSPASYSTRFEMSADGTTWSTIMEGNTKKF